MLIYCCIYLTKEWGIVGSGGGIGLFFVWGGLFGLGNSPRRQLGDVYESCHIIIIMNTPEIPTFC